LEVIERIRGVGGHGKGLDAEGAKVATFRNVKRAAPGERQRKKQIPKGNDRKKDKGNSKGKGAWR
jgi:hypothetical protein